MASQDQPVDDSYPENWFPGVARANEERERAELRRQLEELPTETLQALLDEAKKGS